MSNINEIEESDYIGYKLRIYPTENQIKKFNQYFGMVRFVYNKGKELCDEYYMLNKDNPHAKRTTLGRKDLRRYISELMCCQEYAWLRDINVESWRTAIDDLLNGYTMFYKHATKGPPIYKSKKNANQSFPTRKDRMYILGNQLKISSFKEPILIKKVPKELQGFSNKGIITKDDGSYSGIYQRYSYLNYINPRISYDGIYYYISFSLKRLDDKNNIIKTPPPVTNNISIVLFSIDSKRSLYFNSLALFCKVDTVLENIIICSCLSC